MSRAWRCAKCGYASKDDCTTDHSTAVNKQGVHRNNFCIKAISRASTAFMSCNPAPGLHCFTKYNRYRRYLPLKNDLSCAYTAFVQDLLKSLNHCGDEYSKGVGRVFCAWLFCCHQQYDPGSLSPRFPSHLYWSKTRESKCEQDDLTPHARGAEFMWPWHAILVHPAWRIRAWHSRQRGTIPAQHGLMYEAPCNRYDMKRDEPSIPKNWRTGICFYRTDYMAPGICITTSQIVVKIQQTISGWPEYV